MSNITIRVDGIMDWHSVIDFCNAMNIKCKRVRNYDLEVDSFYLSMITGQCKMKVEVLS